MDRDIEAKPEPHPAPAWDKWLPAIVVAVITVVGSLAVALINRSTTLMTAYVPIRQTQTADARSTSVAMTAQMQLLLSTATPAPTPIPTKTPFSASMLVYSRSDPFADTNIDVEKGDILQITVLGNDPVWNCGRTESIGPDGYVREKGFADLVYPQARPCALIGSISSGPRHVYFAIGSSVTYRATESGSLFLGCNDSKDRFLDNPPESVLEVQVTVGG